eukprot:2161076-Amphidinium_carterae.1
MDPAFGSGCVTEPRRVTIFGDEHVHVWLLLTAIKRRQERREHGELIQICLQVLLKCSIDTADIHMCSVACTDIEISSMNNVRAIALHATLLNPQKPFERAFDENMVCTGFVVDK